MIKLVASDLDGTLLHNYQQTVPKEIYDTIKALHEKGIIFTAASGRQYANIRRLFAPLGFDIPYIAENGSMCVYKEEILATGLTPSKTIRHILDANGIPEDLSHRTLYPFCKRYLLQRLNR